MTENPNTSESIERGGVLATIKKIPPVILIAGILILVIVILFFVGLAFAVFGDVEQNGAAIRNIRDVVIIFIAVEGILIVLGLALLILQITRLVSLLNTEVKPILDNTQQTVKTAQTTVEFVSANIAQPLLRLSGFMTGTTVLFNELFGLKKAIQRTAEKDVEAYQAAQAAAASAAEAENQPTDEDEVQSDEQSK